MTVPSPDPTQAAGTAIGRPVWSAWLILMALGVGHASFAADAPTAPLPPPETITYEVDGLEAPAEIVIDQWGVPHIYAGTHYDAFFVQGFNAARDRLWQIDTWRRRGLGQLAEAFGPAYVEQDTAARLFLYRGDMYREWLAYGSDAKAIATAFTDGINAFVALTRTQPELLPAEFGLLDYTPAEWAPEDVVRIRSHGLWRNVTAEVDRARLACRHGMPVTRLWKVLEPEWEARIPEGLDPCSIPAEVLDRYHLAKAPVRFDTVQLTDMSAAEALRAELIARVAADDVDRALGSNNWVVAPTRTDTGRPILANDPHRAHSVPSLRYVAHLVAPGLNAIGAGEPSLPGISIGHNGTIAFGLTIFAIDQEDLYVYQKETNGYRYRGRAEPFHEVQETIAVRGEAPRTARLRFTRHGPVVHETAARAYAVRAAWLEPGMAPYFGSVEYMRAQNWREFLAAMNRWGAPAENQVYADIDGNIGYKPGGLFPRRTNWDGLLPVPGDGRFEWDGYFDMDALPVEFNPERGFTGTANSMNLPADYPIDERRVGFEWSAPWRYKRLWEVLEGQPRHTFDDSLALQRDYVSVLAREALARMPASVEGDAAEPLAWLKAWDHDLRPGSGEALLFVQWFYRDLPPLIAASLAPEAATDLKPLDSLTILEAMQYPLGQEAALTALASAWEAVRTAHGTDTSQWKWGDVHRIRFAHPLAGRAPAELARQMALPDYPRGGTTNTVNNTTFGDTNFDVTSGASFRMVLDVGNWDAARMTNAPGQSGDPRSPFYGNLLEGWATEGSFPMVYSEDAVRANAVQVIRVVPIEAVGGN
ncbi:MAG: penicillin acylase family protein [Pseudomonadales bacterium]|nr:penicillin acylase family protein [Pseudomonadales bacterium]